MIIVVQIVRVYTLPGQFHAHLYSVNLNFALFQVQMDELEEHKIATWRGQILVMFKIAIGC